MTGTVQAAIDIEVTADGEHVAAESIAHPHFEIIVSGLHVVGDFGAEGRVSSQVVGDSLIVYEDVGSRVSSFEIEEQAFAFHFGRDFQRTFVDHHFPVVGSRAREVMGVPRMGEGDRVEFGFAHGVGDGLDAPTFVQGQHFAGC